MVRCGCRRCITYSFVVEVSQTSFPKSTLLVQEELTCISRIVIYAIMYKCCDIKNIGETGLLLGDRFPTLVLNLKSIRKVLDFFVLHCEIYYPYYVLAS